ncbi:MAG TPA: hypothetical protein VHO06_04220, partial [Polyangia bacterium]|nr:hypothetical protein [Polyangia bacterium]
MNRPDARFPTQLRVVGATDLERRLLEAGARELPSVELTEKMQRALGLSLGAGAAAAGAAAKSTAAGGAGSSAPALAWPAISVGVLALAVTGAVVGLRTTAVHRAAGKPVAIAAPAPVPTLAPPPVAVETPAP